MPVTRKQLKDIMAKVAPGLPYVVENTGRTDLRSLLMGMPASSPDMATAWHEGCVFDTFIVDPTLLTVAPNVECVAMIASHEYAHVMLKSCGKNNSDEENRADLFGYGRMLEVGYDPRKAIDMWVVSAKWADERGLVNVSQFHSDDGVRLNAMLKWIDSHSAVIEARFGKGE